MFHADHILYLPPYNRSLADSPSLQQLACTSHLRTALLSAQSTHSPATLLSFPLSGTLTSRLSSPNLSKCSRRAPTSYAPRRSPRSLTPAPPPCLLKEYIGIEFAKDLALQTGAYDTTQQNVFRLYLPNRTAFDFVIANVGGSEWGGGSVHGSDPLGSIFHGSASRGYICPSWVYSSWIWPSWIFPYLGDLPLTSGYAPHGGMAG